MPTTAPRWDDTQIEAVIAFLLELVAVDIAPVAIIDERDRLWSLADANLEPVIQAFKSTRVTRFTEDEQADFAGEIATPVASILARCRLVDCSKPVRTTRHGGLCMNHLAEMNRRLDGMQPRKYGPTLCATSGCTREVHSGGLCSVHARALRRRAEGKHEYVRRTPYTFVPSTCSEPDCDREAKARGLCSMHYQRARPSPAQRRRKTP
jgi:hypothetical protein